MNVLHLAEPSTLSNRSFEKSLSFSGMLKMLMDTDLDPNQMDYAQTAYDSGKELISLINEVLDQAKIESGRLELEDVPFDPRSLLDNVLSMFSGKCHEKGIEVKFKLFPFSYFLLTRFSRTYFDSKILMGKFFLESS